MAAGCSGRAGELDQKSEGGDGCGGYWWETNITESYKFYLLAGIPDDRAGEIPRAYVVKADANLEEKDVQVFVAKALSKHKHLVGGVEFVKEIPKSAAGKILRKDLKAAYERRGWGVEEGILNKYVLFQFTNKIFHNIQWDLW